MDKLTATFPLLCAANVRPDYGFTSTGSFLVLDAGAKKILLAALRAEVCAPAARSASQEART